MCTRLQIEIAKIQQNIPELKRDGSNVLGSLWMSTLFGDNNTSRANSILTQIDFIPTLTRELQEDPDRVIANFEEIRKHCQLLLSLPMMSPSLILFFQ